MKTKTTKDVWDRLRIMEDWLVEALMEDVDMWELAQNVFNAEELAEYKSLREQCDLPTR